MVIPTDVTPPQWTYADPVAKAKVWSLIPAPSQEEAEVVVLLVYY
jgi:hypothetical protein